MIDSSSDPTSAGAPRHRAGAETSETDPDGTRGARQRLLSLMEDADGVRLDGHGNETRPDDHDDGSRSPATLTARSGFLRRLAHRWLPASWQQSRVDPGRAGCLGIGLLAVLVAGGVSVSALSSQPAAEPVPVLPVVTSAMPTTASSAPPEQLVVSMVGRVRDPGLVTVEPGARVADALHAAGGPLPGTNVLALNLARELDDGEQLYVGVPVPPGAGRRSGPDPDGGRADGTRPKIDLNTADEEELEELPGVGPVTAERIVRWRTDNGGFDSVEQLRAVNGIGEVKFSQLRDLVRV